MEWRRAGRPLSLDYGSAGARPAGGLGRRGRGRRRGGRTSVLGGGGAEADGRRGRDGGVLGQEVAVRMVRTVQAPTQIRSPSWSGTRTPPGISPPLTIVPFAEPGSSTTQ